MTSRDDLSDHFFRLVPDPAVCVVYDELNKNGFLGRVDFSSPGKGGSRTLFFANGLH